MAKKLRDFQGSSSFVLPQTDITNLLPELTTPAPVQTPVVAVKQNQSTTSTITLDDILFKPAVHHRDAANKFVGAYIPDKYHNLLKELSNASGIPAKFIIANILSNFLESDGKSSLLWEIEKLKTNQK